MVLQVEERRYGAGRNHHICFVVALWQVVVEQIRQQTVRPGERARQIALDNANSGIDDAQRRI